MLKAVQMLEAVQMTVKVDNVADAVHQIIEQYFDNVASESNELVAQTAAETVEELSRYNGKYATGKYASSWRVKQTAKSKKSNEVVVYNTKAGLTHLLEHGHIKVVHGKVLVFTAARPHIASAEQHAIRKLTDGIERIAKQ